MESAAAGLLDVIEDPNENAEGALPDGFEEVDDGNGEKEKPEVAGLAAVLLEPNEKDGVEAGAAAVVAADFGVSAGLPKLKLGREEEEADEDDCAAVLADVPLLEGWNDGAPAESAEAGFLSAPSRCLRY